MFWLRVHHKAFIPLSAHTRCAYIQSIYMRICICMCKLRGFRHHYIHIICLSSQITEAAICVYVLVSECYAQGEMPEIIRRFVYVWWCEAYLCVRASRGRAVMLRAMQHMYDAGYDAEIYMLCGRAVREYVHFPSDVAAIAMRAKLFGSSFHISVRRVQ